MEKISVIIPCLNEQEGIGICISKIISVFDKHNLKGEIIIVDNGCTDNTINIINSFKDKRIKITNESNQGYGNAYIKGFKHVKGHIIIMGDGDDTYDFNEIPRLLDKINEGYDFVIGNRMEIEKGAMPILHRYIGRPIFSFLLNRLFDLHISDSHCGFGAIRKDSLDKLNLSSSGMEFASEILIKAKRNNLRIKEIPIVYSPRLGNSKLRTFRDGFRHLNLITTQKLKN